jgi:uncharacterized protein (TIGR02453 family)
MSEVFAGFPREGFDFLRDLAANNNKSWFEANRRGYDEGLLGPARVFVVAMGMALADFAPGIHAEPRVSGSIFRIHRDIRFSRDKRPYKTHFDMWFWQGSRHSRDCPGYFLRLEPDRLTVGAGRYRFDKEPLQAYRRALADDARGAGLERALDEVRAAGGEVGGEHYKRVPRGFDADHPRADLLRHNALHAWIGESLPPEAHSAEFVDFCAERCRKLEPVQRWILEMYDW